MLAQSFDVARPLPPNDCFSVSATWDATWDTTLAVHYMVGRWKPGCWFLPWSGASLCQSGTERACEDVVFGFEGRTGPPADVVWLRTARGDARRLH